MHGDLVRKKEDIGTEIGSLFATDETERPEWRSTRNC